MTLWHDCESALWLSDTGPAVREGIRWLARLAAVTLYPAACGAVGVFLAGGLVAALR